MRSTNLTPLAPAAILVVTIPAGVRGPGTGRRTEKNTVLKALDRWRWYSGDRGGWGLSFLVVAARADQKIWSVGGPIFPQFVDLDREFSPFNFFTEGSSELTFKN